MILSFFASQRLANESPSVGRRYKERYGSSFFPLHHKYFIPFPLRLATNKLPAAYPLFPL